MCFCPSFFLLFFDKGCTTQVARDAQNDRTRVNSAGLSCGYSGCKTRLGLDVVRTLLEVGARTLPDVRAIHGDPSLPILPLTEKEVKLKG
jgi:hypothetical protein